MPPVTKITKEDIVNSSYEIARNKGIEGVNARAIAAYLNCSIQPVFHNFSNMDELKKSLLEKIKLTYKNYIMENIDKEKPYKQIGLGYIKFAKEEPKLFKILFMSEYNVSPGELINSDTEHEDILKYATIATGIDNKNIIHNFYLEMWIFTHGIATMIASGTCTFTDKEISDMLTDEFNALMYLKNKEGENK